MRSQPRAFPRRSLASLAGAAAMTAEAAAQGRALPQGPISFVVPYGAGSTNDILARLLAPDLGTQLGQTVVVENRPGAGGTVGIGQVARARPDGTTLALVSASSIPINAALYRNLPFNAVRDLALIGIAGSSPNVLIVAAESGITSLAELLAAARRPGQPPMRHFAPGNGTSQHLSCVQLANLAGIPVENITYRGPSEGLAGLLAGEVAFGFASVPSIAGLLRDGRVRALGTTGPRQSALAGVPTLASLGYPTFADTDVWYGVATQRAVPAAVLAELRGAFDRAMQAPALRERLQRAGFDPAAPISGDQADAFLASQVTFWRDLVRAANVTMD